MNFSTFSGKLGRTINIIEDAAVLVYIHDNDTIQIPSGEALPVQVVEISLAIAKDFDFWYERLKRI